MRKVLLAIVCYLLFVYPVFAETSLWVVQAENSTLYIGGTYHILRENDYPLPPEFEAAYKKADILVLETDPGKFNDPQIQQLMLAGALYPEGSGLDENLSPQTFEMLKRHCEDSGIPIASLNRFKPSMALLTLLSVEMQKLGVNQPGVDLYFYNKATAEGKKAEALESVGEQIEFILSMGDENADKFVEYSIRDLENLGETMDALISAWRGGNEAEIYGIIAERMKKDFPEIYRTLLVDRNRRWLPRIEGFLQTPEKELVLVGVGHLVGEDGVIELLKRRGYQVRKFN